MIKSRIAVAGALLAVAGAANAGFSVTPTITSDYDFRGISQTDGDPAFQLGATYTFENGFYAGIWGSNVDFGPGKPDIEIDYSVGFAGGDAAESFAYDLGLIYYSYPSAGEANSFEAYAGITKGIFGGKIWVSNDLASSGDSSIYTELNAGIPLPEGFSIPVHVGYSFGDAFSGGAKYVDYSVGVSKNLGNFALNVKWVDTDIDGLPHRSKVIGTISTTLPWAAE